MGLFRLAVNPLLSGGKRTSIPKAKKAFRLAKSVGNSKDGNYNNKKGTRFTNSYGKGNKKDVSSNQFTDLYNTRRKSDKNHNSVQQQMSFKYGEFGGLKEILDEDAERDASLIEKITEFEHLKILPAVRAAAKDIIVNESLIKSMKMSEEIESFRKSIRPSPIQVLTIKKLSKDLMAPKLKLNAIAAETGSGKTMAYLIPLMDYLKRQELETPDVWNSIKDNAIIRSVILVPTHELVHQVYSTIKNTEDSLNFHTYKWGSGTSHEEFIEKLKSRIDILVTTPAKLLSLFKIRVISRPDKILSQVKFVVLDEADTLLDRSWVEDTYHTIKNMPNTNHLIFCSATIPNEFNKTLERLFPTVTSISTPRLHKLPQSLNFKIINASLNPFKGSKMKVLAQILYAIMHDGTEPGLEKRCIVFVNEKKHVPKVVELLNSKYGHHSVGLTGSDSAEERLQKLKVFINSPKQLTNESAQQSDVQNEMVDQENHPSMETNHTNEVKIPNSNIILDTSMDNAQEDHTVTLSDALPIRVLVTTDLMARGLNFQGIKNIILYDVPKTSIDLVHRVGRTSRMKQRGRVFMIIDNKTRSWAKAIPSIIRKNKSLT
ncbi:ATP-dependent RNA helicase NDAI_0I00790 [Naumovozyma dairenensis CBS 421]|uniref:RNA helicase n=1 Tax=Naumovozyma dairenensis (strain ATCC 10597 / BCRC 20456 / CBS 421 / NBRC 0211 / NRRL Y-12639) TaxID=1071378 RepID=G0WFT7_NAUDC|nr:hypothetical protein NDAI_0I00790 [Naumovozyma dairenensis CBS 421]CCD26648.1 hypothetical protein NDAI_0I00790 [Naumovozyma dairenensis CBS 421]